MLKENPDGLPRVGALVAGWPWTEGMMCNDQSRFGVLIAHQSLRVREELRTALESEPGWRCAEAESSKAAFREFFTSRPDAAVIEVCLPGQGGFDTAQCFKQAFPGCFVVMLSNSRDPCIEAVSKMIGAIGVCYNPDDPEQILNVLRPLKTLRDTHVRSEAQTPVSAG